MDVVESTEVSVLKKSRKASLTIAGRHVNEVVQTAMMAMLVNATLPSGEVHGHLSGGLLDPLLVHEGDEKDRENLQEFVSAEAPSSGEASSSPVVR